MFYQAGYPLLISPAYWFTSDPAIVYRLVIGVNALVGAALVFPAYAMARRLGVAGRPAYVLAQVTALLPALFYYSQFALTDAVLPLVVSCWLLLIHTWMRRRAPAAGLGAAVLAAFCYCTHPRGVVIVLVQGALLVLLPLVGGRADRRANRRTAAVAAVFLAGCGGLSWALNLWLRHRLYPAGAASLGHLLTQRLTSIDGLTWTLTLAAGKLWYLVVSSWGIGGIGLVAVAVVAVRASGDLPARVTAGTALVTLTGIAIATSAAVPDEGTVANFAYGRYLCCLLPFFFLAGGVALVRATATHRLRLALAAAAIGTGSAGIVWLLAGDRLRTEFFGPYDFPEICFLTWTWSALNLWSATWCALLVLTVLVLAVTAFDHRYSLWAVTAALVALNLTAIAVSTDRISRYWVGQLTPEVSLAAAGLRAGDRVAVSYPGMPWRVWVSQAFEVPSGLVPFDRYDRAAPARPITLIVVPWDSRFGPTSSWPAARPPWRLVTAVTSPGVGGWAAWRRAPFPAPRPLSRRTG